jgi:hypothetical protein
MIYIGVDVGLDGAVAVLDSDGNVLELTDTPTTTIKSGKKNKREYIVGHMSAMMEAYCDDTAGTSVVVGIEAQHSFPGQGVSSMFNLGKGYGLWIGIVVAKGFSYSLIPPQRWKKAMMDGMGKEKAASCVRAQQLYPDCELFTARGRALDGRGDALLIATYIKQMT